MQSFPSLVPTKRQLQSSSPERSDQQWVPESAQRALPEIPSSPPIPSSPVPSPRLASETVLKAAFNELLNNIDNNAFVGRVGGVSGSEMRMPMRANDGRSLTWSKWALDVSYSVIA